MGRGKNWLSEKILIESLIKHQGWIMGVSQEVDRTPANLYKRIRKSKKLRDLWAELNQNRDTFIIELAEQKFITALRADERWAIIKALNDKGKARGYGQATVSELSVNADNNTESLSVMVLPSNGREAENTVKNKKK